MRVAEIGPPASASSGTKVSPMPSASARRARNVGVAATAVAEREVRPAHQVPRAEALMQHLGDERLRRHLAEVVVERQFVQQA